MFRLSAMACAISACALVIWAGYTAFSAAGPGLVGTGTGSTDEAGLVVDNPEQDLGERPVGEHRVIFRVTNRSDRKAEVFGYPGRCGNKCCYSSRHSERQNVAPGATVEVLGELEVFETGPFEFEGNLFLNDGGQLRAVRFRLTGVGIPGEKPNATTP
jgi:hypothetical protein